jgi:DNA-binding PadR family transcriptional regulator
MAHLLESTKFYILLALAGGPRTGAEIRQLVLGDTMGIYLRDGTLYEALASMARAGLIERDEAKIYRLADKGRRVLEHESRVLRDAVQLSRERLGWR